MVEATFYRDIFIAISGGIAGAFFAFLGQLAVQRYRTYLDDVSDLREQVYIPVYNEVASIVDGAFPSTPRTKWQGTSPYLRLKVDKGLREDLDDYKAKFEKLIRAENELVAARGVFEEKVPEEMKARSDAHLTIRAEGDFDLPNHSINVTTFLSNFEEEIFNAESSSEMRENLAETVSGDLVYKLDAANEEWNEVIFRCLQSESAQRWKRLRDEIRKDAKSLEPKLRPKITGWRERLGV